MLDLLNVQRADSLSKQDFCRERLKKTDYQERTVREIIENGECYRRKDLAVNGNDIRELGYEKEEIRNILDRILNAVVYEELENDRESIINYVKSIK